MSDQPQSTFRRQIETILETQIARYPFLVQMRAVWRQLQEERESWILLLPLALILFVVTYRAERKRVNTILRDLAD